MSQWSYLSTNKVYTYPSANSLNGGSINSEVNIASLIKSISSNHVIYTNSEDLKIEESTNDHILINKGKCLISGHLVDIKESRISYNKQELSEQSDNTMKVIVKIIKDNTGNMLGDVLESEKLNSSSSTYKSQSVCKGVVIGIIPNNLDIDEDSLVLGQLIYNSGEVLVVPSSERFKSISSRDILNPQDLVVSMMIDSLECKYEGFPGIQLTSSLRLVPNDANNTCDLFYSDGGKTTAYRINYPISESGGLNGVSDTLSRLDHTHNYIKNKDYDTDEESQFVSTGLKIGKDPGSDNYVFEVLTSPESGDSKNIKCKVNGNFSADKVFNAVWNDYAELYKKYDISEDIKPGDLICKVRGVDAYSKSSLENSRLVVGVCSDTYGHLLGGDKNLSMEENLNKYIPVALAGRVYVNVVDGISVEEGDLMIVSAFPGKAIKCSSSFDSKGLVVGKALESSDGTKDKILIQVMLG